MQLLYPTARRMRWDLRKYTGLNFTSSWMLFNSRYNISLGTTYLKLLEKEFKGNKISMIASYNAGEKNVAKWRKKYQELSEDEFVESIPINQTKNYVKKVLKAHYIYNYIYDFSNDSNYISLEEINLPNIKNQKKKKGVRAQNIELIQKKEKKSKGSKY
jgi:soluble lytic murein transglycosylase-like protein